MIKAIVFIFFCILFTPKFILSQSNSILLQELNTNNVEVRFELGSTWHVVKGVVKSLSGKVWLKKARDLNSIVAEIVFDVESFDTENISRDYRLKEVMNLNQYPNIFFKLDQIKQNCNLNKMKPKSICNEVIVGSLTMLGVVKNLEIPILIKKEIDNTFRVTGRKDLIWQNYGIEDPSIAIANVDKIVTIFFECIVKVINK